MKTSVFVGASLDGFIARENDGLDFLPDDPGEGHGYQEFYDTVDVMIIGRRLYEVALGFGTWPYGPKPVFVLSTNEPLFGPLDHDVRLRHVSTKVLSSGLVQSEYVCENQ